MREFEKITSIVPPLFDIHHSIPPHHWQELHATLKLVENGHTTLSYTDRDAAEKTIAALSTDSGQPTPGSSILGIFSTFPPAARERSLVHTIALIDPAGREQPHSQSFRHHFERRGIRTHGVEKIGSELSTVRIMVNTATGERSFLKIKTPGDTDEALLTHLPILDENTLLVIDTYELTRETTRQGLTDSIATLLTHSIALSLGDVNVLSQEVTQLIANWGQRQLLAAVFGNYGEFKKLSKLLGKHPSHDPSAMASLLATVLDTDIVITCGSKGIFAVINNILHHQPAEHVDVREIKSTSGAGDSVMGIILGGLATGLHAEEVLRRSVGHAANVIRSPYDNLDYNWD